MHTGFAFQILALVFILPFHQSRLRSFKNVNGEKNINQLLGYLYVIRTKNNKILRNFIEDFISIYFEGHVAFHKQIFPKR